MKAELNLEEILARLADSNQAALEELFDYYYPRLYNFSKAFLKLEESIDDILQEVFVRIWENRRHIKQSYTFESYIFTITRNKLLNELRSRLNNQKTRDRIFQSAVAREYLPFEAVEFDELAQKVEFLIEELPARQKEIFKLSRIEGLSHKEIAEKLNITPKTVEYHITQAILYLKEKLKAFGLMSLLYFYLFL